MVSVFNFDIYTIPEKFIEKSYLLSLIDNEEEVYVDDFISSFINQYFHGNLCPVPYSNQSLIHQQLFLHFPFGCVDNIR